MSGVRSFQIPNEISEIPGTEGWREMYPAHLVFAKDNPKQIEYERSRLWVLDSLHTPAPLTPLECYANDMWRLTLSQSNNRIYVVPNSRGLDQRMLNGYLYFSAIEVEDPEEVGRRASLFEKRAGHYYGNWDSIFQRWHGRIEKIVEDMESVTFKDLPALEPESTVTEGRGFGESYALIKEYARFWDIIQLSWQYHFELLNLAYGADCHYIQVMQQIFPDIPGKVLGQLIAGFDAKLFRPPEELQKLAIMAVDLGLAEAVSSAGGWGDLQGRMDRSDAGKRWLEAFEAARYPWFEMSCGIGWYHHEPSWNQNLDYPVSQIKNYIARLQAGETVTRPKAEVIAHRDAMTEEYRALIEDESVRNQFDAVLGLARMVAPFAEDHNWYCSSFEHSIFFRKMRQLGEVFVNHGLTREVDDIFYLHRFEIPQVLYDLCSGWAMGMPAVGSYSLPDKIERRKDILEKFREWEAPPALGPAPKVVNDPFLLVHFGITTERIDGWLDAAEGMTAGEVRKLSGFAASNGVVEGVARVCRDPGDIKSLQHGEILVASTTSPTWAPAFQLVSGCVTDIGGTCCHAAIVAREYGIPAVAGTGYATQAIRSGDRIRVNGDNGVVEILEQTAG